MQRLEVSGAVRPIYGSLGVKRLSMIEIRLNARYTLDQDWFERLAIGRYPSFITVIILFSWY